MSWRQAVNDWLRKWHEPFAGSMRHVVGCGCVINCDHCAPQKVQAGGRSTSGGSSGSAHVDTAAPALKSPDWEEIDRLDAFGTYGGRIVPYNGVWKIYLRETNCELWSLKTKEEAETKFADAVKRSGYSDDENPLLQPRAPSASTALPAADVVWMWWLLELERLYGCGPRDVVDNHEHRDTFIDAIEFSRKTFDAVLNVNATDCNTCAIPCDCAAATSSASTALPIDIEAVLVEIRDMVNKDGVVLKGPILGVIADALHDLRSAALTAQSASTALKWQEVGYDRNNFSDEPGEGYHHWDYDRLTIIRGGKLYQLKLPPEPGSSAAVGVSATDCNTCGGLGYIQMTDGLGKKSRLPCDCAAAASSASKCRLSEIEYAAIRFFGAVGSSREPEAKSLLLKAVEASIGVRTPTDG